MFDHGSRSDGTLLSAGIELVGSGERAVALALARAPFLNPEVPEEFFEVLAQHNEVDSSGQAGL